jgi:hypothetical protein
MKVAGLVILAAIALAVLTGSCSGGEFFTYTGDPFSSAQSGSTSTSTLASNQLPPPDPPSAAIKRAVPPAVWTAAICGEVKSWNTGLATRDHELEQHVANADSLDQTRDLYVQFWEETAEKTDELLRQLDAAGHPAVRGGERIARGYRLGFAKTLPPMQMARAVAAALPDDPGRFSAGLAEIRTNMARAFAIRDDYLFALHNKLNKTLPAKLRHAFNNNATCRAI